MKNMNQILIAIGLLTMAGLSYGEGIKIMNQSPFPIKINVEYEKELKKELKSDIHDLKIPPFQAFEDANRMRSRVKSVSVKYLANPEQPDLWQEVTQSPWKLKPKDNHPVQ